MLVRAILRCSLLGLLACGPSVESGASTGSGSTVESDGADPEGTTADSATGPTRTAGGGTAGNASQSTSTGGGTSIADSSTGEGGSTGSAGGFVCGDAPCAPGPEACILCNPPAATACVDATQDPNGIVDEVCGRPQGQGAVIVACESSEACADETYCMWTLSFGYTIVECAPLACAAECGCEPQLRQVCDTLADCPDCAVACDGSLEFGLSLRTCK